jgi:ubiquinone/menaquinone biosynthesis C-methylase UbiE
MSEKIQSANEEDLKRLRRMLGKVAGHDLEAVKRRLERSAKPRPGAEEIRVLDIACGDCREAEVLGDFVAELKGAPEAAVKLTGIDVRAREIADAARKFGKRQGPRDERGRREFEFLTGDATKLKEIFDQALDKVGDEGRLVITSYFDKEHALALEAIQKLGGELIRTEFNEETRELITPGKSMDRHVAIFRKKK